MLMLIEWLRFSVAALLMLIGLATLLSSVIGQFRFKYVLNRIHVAAKCDTVGLLFVFLSLLFVKGFTPASLKLMMVIFFLWIANPVAGNLIAHLEVCSNPKAGEEYEVIDIVRD